MEIRDWVCQPVLIATYRDSYNSAVKNATYYTYDIDGNVKTLWQQIDGLTDYTNPETLKRLDYEYDLVSGKVNLVRYQDNKPDRFYYQYKYDAENRLTEAWSGIRLVSDAYTGQGTLIADHAKRNAKYYYYLHGPLARVELGDERRLVQGLDYAYTLQGWLKGVNGQNPNGDMFGDGTDTTVAKDAFAYSLGYYNGDYTPVTNNATALNNNFSYSSGVTGKNLFNGNISSSTMSIPQLSTTVNGFTYSYDQLNRIKQVNRHEGIQNGWTSPISKYHEEFTYDANGNILSAIRNDNNGAMDNLAYNYNKVNGQLVNNKLNFVTNGTNTANSFTSQSTGNYDYDAIGNLIKDKTAGISNIDWTVYGKIKAISKAGGNLDYSYNSAGQRVSKLTNGLTTWYVRDAQGNTMAVYDNAAGSKTWKEQHLYGSSRLGTWNPNVAAIDNNSTTTGKDVWQTVGTTQYELSNHLGNVMATITDKRLQVDNGSGGIASYTADVSSAQEYYAFGSLMPGRATNATGYRYGFNSQEKSLDIDPGGNHNTAEFWEYDTRIGRRWNLDPKPNLAISNYAVFENNPLAYTDFLGDTIKIYGVAEATHTTLSEKGGIKDRASEEIQMKGGIVLTPAYSSSNKLIGYNVFDRRR